MKRFRLAFNVGDDDDDDDVGCELKNVNRTRIKTRIPTKCGGWFERIRM